MDADLIMNTDPAPFMRNTRQLTISTPLNEGPVGLVPWRRYMAGSLVANRALLRSPLLTHLHDYIRAGLTQPRGWMLDQNALTYAAEHDTSGDFTPLNPYKRPAQVSRFMNRWEQNYTKHTR